MFCEISTTVRHVDLSLKKAVNKRFNGAHARETVTENFFFLSFMIASFKVRLGGRKFLELSVQVGTF